MRYITQKRKVSRRDEEGGQTTYFFYELFNERQSDSIESKIVNLNGQPFYKVHLNEFINNPIIDDIIIEQYYSNDIDDALKTYDALTHLDILKLNGKQFT